MADSSSTQFDNCVCIYAFPDSPKIKAKNENTDQLIFDLRVSTTLISENPTNNPITKNLIHTQQTSKTFTHPRKHFLSISEASQYYLTCKLFLDIPFPMQNLHWGFNYPENQYNKHATLNLDKVAEHVLTVARNSPNKSGKLIILVRKFQNSTKEYEKNKVIFHSELRNASKHPLEDWMMENKNDERFIQCLWFIFEKLHRMSPKDNRYFGLRSVMMMGKDEDGECSICIKEMIQYKQVIRMPCSHIFHGFCIFKWLNVNPKCPLCRFQLFPKEDEAMSTVAINM